MKVWHDSNIISIPGNHLVYILVDGISSHSRADTRNPVKKARRLTDRRSTDSH